MPEVVWLFVRDLGINIYYMFGLIHFFSSELIRELG